MYDENNPLYLKRYGNNHFTFNNNKLTELTKQLNDGSYVIDTFGYDDNGLRTSKTIQTRSSSGTLTSSKTIWYFYDGNRLVTQKEGTNRLDFLYDEQGLLYGFIRNNDKKYFYIRDIYLNILGIVDKNGQLVVKYDCDAYGNKVSITDTSGINLGVENPFRFKGYYYDEEINIYYINSRYYMPELYRFISPDKIDYLEEQNINGLNLYCYCFNDPVNYIDFTGNSGYLILLIIALGTAIIASKSENKTNSKGGISFNEASNIISSEVLGQSGSMGINNLGTSMVSSKGFNLIAGGGIKAMFTKDDDIVFGILLSMNSLR